MSLPFPPPALSEAAARGLVRRLAGNPDLAASISPHLPTAELPGTPGKVTVMAARREAGVALFHADDARFEDADEDGVEPGEGDRNGESRKGCLDGLSHRAADVTGRRVGDEPDIRARLLAAALEHQARQRAAAKARARVRRACTQACQKARKRGGCGSCNSP